MSMLRASSATSLLKLKKRAMSLDSALTKPSAVDSNRKVGGQTALWGEETIDKLLLRQEA